MNIEYTTTDISIDIYIHTELRTIHGMPQDILVHLPNTTDTRGDELKVVELSLKVATGLTEAALLIIPRRRVWSGTGAQATLSPTKEPLGIKNPITSPADTVMFVRTSDIVPPPLWV